LQAFASRCHNIVEALCDIDAPCCCPDYPAGEGGANQVLKLAVITVVHPASVPFHGALGDSLRRQSDDAFDLLVLDDGCGAPLAPLTAGLAAEVRPAAPGRTPAALRRDLIAWAATRASAVLFIDADDWCAPDRIAICRDVLMTHDAVAHDFDLVDETGNTLRRFIGGRVPDGKRLVLDDIADGNFLGLSNTAARLPAILGAATRVPDHVIAFDWAMFTAFLAAGNDMVYVGRPLASYRQYAGNVAAVTRSDDATIRRAVQVKVDHYNLFRYLLPRYAQNAEYFTRLAEMLEKDAVFAKAYCDEARAEQSAESLWWETAPSNRMLDR